MPLANLLKACEMTASTSEAMRLIKQGGVKIDSIKVEDPKLVVMQGQESIYQVGKRKFLKIKT
jgi:tyrosyl-tRNA synthetase